MDIEKMIESYGRLKNLHLSSAELGMKWQSLYYHLRKAGVAVTGDKSRYGSISDKLGARGEGDFKRLVPKAICCNDGEWQSKIDFSVHGHTVDVKSAKLVLANGRYKSLRWAFSIKKQSFIADFFVCMAYDKTAESLIKVLLIPAELVRGFHTVNLPESGGKWSEFEINPDDLAPFFDDLGQAKQSSDI